MDTAPKKEMMIEAFGYEVESEATRPAKLEELTLRAAPATLLALSAFFRRVAISMDEHGEKFGHEHFRDFVGSTFEGTDLIVVAPKKE